jgi:hypothetical protein
MPTFKEQNGPFLRESLPTLINDLSNINESKLEAFLKQKQTGAPSETAI